MDQAPKTTVGKLAKRILEYKVAVAPGGNKIPFGDWLRKQNGNAVGHAASSTHAATSECLLPAAPARPDVAMALESLLQAAALPQPDVFMTEALQHGFMMLQEQKRALLKDRDTSAARQASIDFADVSTLYENLLRRLRIQRPELSPSSSVSR